MNIISNNCASSFLYKKTNKEFNNPFMWCFIEPKDYIKLIINYEKINFNNFKIIKMPKDVGRNSKIISYKLDNDFNMLGVNIDNFISAYYTHYLEINKKDKLEYDEVNVFITDVKQYVMEKYKVRLKRMKEKLLFFVVGYKHHSWNKELLQELCDIKTNYKIIIITNENLIYKDNVKIIYDDMINGNPKILVDKYFNEIKNEIENYYEKSL